MDPNRIRPYLQAACSTLNFDIGEIWCCDDTPDINASAPFSSSSMHFVELYTSPSINNLRSKLMKPPSADWAENQHEASNHKFSPMICEAVRDGGHIVWANTTLSEGLLGRSDLPLRTAVGAPVCSAGYDLCILVLFSLFTVQNTPAAMEFLYTLAQAASDPSSAFLPASASVPIFPAITAGRSADEQGRKRKLAAIQASLPCGIKLQTLTLGQVPQLMRTLKSRSGGMLGFWGSTTSTLGVDFGDGMDVLDLTEEKSLWGSTGQGTGAGTGTGTGMGLGVLPGLSSLVMSPQPSPLLSPMPRQIRRASVTSVEWPTVDNSYDIEGMDGDGEDYTMWIKVMDQLTGGASIPASPLRGWSPGPVSKCNSPVRGGLTSVPSDQSLSSLFSKDLIAVGNDGGDSGGPKVSLMPLGGGDLQAYRASSGGMPSPHPDEGSSTSINSWSKKVNNSGMQDADTTADNANNLSGNGCVVDQLGCWGLLDILKQTRFDEFIQGFLTMSAFHASDLWLPSPALSDGLFLSRSNVQDPRLSKWTHLSKNVALKSGVGLPGMVFKMRRSQWEMNYGEYDAARNPLAPVARLLGIRSSFGVPIPVGNGACGVVMFYSMDSLPL
ncbi:unnamed protein product, partial [Choristocarpus tenellus]